MQKVEKKVSTKKTNKCNSFVMRILLIYILIFRTTTDTNGAPLQLRCDAGKKRQQDNYDKGT